MREYPTSPKKQALIDAKLNTPIEVGESLYVLGMYMDSYNKTKKYGVDVTNIVSDTQIEVVEWESRDQFSDRKIIDITNILERITSTVGADPFYKSRTNVRFIAYQLESIIYKLELYDSPKKDKYHTKNGILIKAVNWNPFVYNKNGEKEYYQRGFVWELSDKQLLLESIYNGIDCGKVLVRERSYARCEKMAKDGETDIAFLDIVDGKQRMDAIRGFLYNEYPDMHGNYYNDLSDYAQRRLTDHQLFAYAEMDENVTDEEVIEQFLKLNFCGVLQSQQHIEYVKSIQKKL